MKDLPESWSRIEITEVLEDNNNGKPFQQGWSPRCENFPAPEGKWGVLKTTSIQHGKFWDHENKFLPDHLEPRPHLEVKLGDVLMTCAGPRARCGVACPVERTRSKLMMSGKMYRFRPYPEAMHPKYLSYMIQTAETQHEIDQMKTGINDSGLNLTHSRFAALKVVVAPLNEQRRIVAKIEELFSELNKGVESLKTARAKLNIYRQAVLKHAFEGKLTAQWRVARIDEECAAPIISSKEYGEEEMERLPDGWNYVRLSQFTQPDRPITYGVIKLGAHVKDGIPTLRSSDVRKLRIDLDSVKRISPEIAVQYQRTFLKGGEVLITVRGTLGGVAVVTDKLSGWNISREVAMIAPTDDLEPHYLQYYLASPQTEAWLKSRSRGVAYTGINLDTLRGMPVIHCPIDEQREITRRINQKLSLTDIAEREIAIQQKKIDALRQSILKRAFSGQLIPQDPDDEPASLLLERIKAEKAARSQNNTRAKRRRTTATA